MTQLEQPRPKSMILVMLVVVYFIALTLMILGTIAAPTTNLGVSIGLVLLYAELVCIMFVDWRGFATLKGPVQPGVSKLPGLAIGYIIIPYIMLPIYFARAAREYHQWKQAKLARPLELRHEIAHLEAQLGILPSTSGTCRACQKPLQVGAEFCQYCGVPVVERPKVCPNCATTTLPDAKWCPKCRTALS